jgi:hypothetical protein
MALVYFDFRARFASLTPAPPPFSGMNSTAAFSRAATSGLPGLGAPSNRIIGIGRFEPANLLL